MRSFSKIKTPNTSKTKVPYLPQPPWAKNPAFGYLDDVDDDEDEEGEDDVDSVVPWAENLKEPASMPNLEVAATWGILPGAVFPRLGGWHFSR